MGGAISRNNKKILSLAPAKGHETIPKQLYRLLLLYRFIYALKIQKS